MTAREMTKTEREELKRLARERARVAKADVDRRTADLRASFEKQIVTEYEYNRDETWKAAVAAAATAVQEAQEIIATRCEELGIPRELAPALEFQWIGRGPHAIAQRQGELRRAAYQRIEAMARTAKHEIDRSALAIQTQLVVEGLTSARAVEFLAEMPSVEELMPPVDLQQLSEGTADEDGL